MDDPGEKEVAFSHTPLAHLVQIHTHTDLEALAEEAIALTNWLYLL